MIKNKGLIIKGVGGIYTVLPSGSTAEVLARPRGIFRKQKLRIMPGDRVEFEESGDPDCPYTIVEVEARTNIFIRPPLANLDRLIIVSSLFNPEPDWYFIDKMLILAEANSVEPILCFTKADLLTTEELINFNKKIDVYKKTGFICLVGDCGSAGEWRANLSPYIEKKIVSLAGQSGVGKSTLLNMLMADELMLTGRISDRLGRGKHTTRHVELFALGNGYIADTPGFSSLELQELGLTEQDVEKAYPEFLALGNCKYVGCRHLCEPGCTVLAALEADNAAKHGLTAVINDGEKYGVTAWRYERYKFFRESLLNNKVTYGRSKL